MSEGGRRRRHGPRAGARASVAALLFVAAPGCALFRPAVAPIEPLTRADLDVHEGPHLVGLVDSGWRALALRVHLIRTARDSVELQTFIWTEDEVGKLVGHELVAAARRGVRVRVLSDGMHTRLSAPYAAHLATAEPNLELRAYNPRNGQLGASLPALVVDGALSFAAQTQRAHDKLMVVDGARVLVGGRNIENTYYDYAAGANFRDREVLAEGPVAADAVRSFERFWEYERTVRWTDLTDVAAALRAGGAPFAAAPGALGIDRILAEVDSTLAELDAPAELLTTDLFEVEGVALYGDLPGKVEGEGLAAPNGVSDVLAGLVRSAERSVLVQTPYFVLTERTMRMLREVREEHPDIVLRSSSNSLASTDIFPAQAVAYRQKRRLIQELGLHLYEFKARPGDLGTYVEGLAPLEERTAKEVTLCLHSKSLVIDGELAAVGTHNVGPRSAHLNTEVMLLVWDRAFAAALTTSIEQDLHPRNSWVVWKREHPPVVGEVQTLLEQLSSVVGELTSLDLWPSFYASCFELRDGAQQVPPGHPDFYERYRAVGLFPGVSNADERVWLTRILKAVGGVADPLL